MITNPDFQDAGASAGLANAWTLRSSCAREAVAPFAPADSSEGFERWFAWVGALGAATLAPFAPSGTIEDFDAWPYPLFALELSAGLVDETATDGFETAWWQGTPAFAWGTVADVAGVLVGGAAIELFATWQAGATYVFAFPAGALTDAAFADGAVESFTTWTTMNTTLG